jgi:hypothetical protein
LPELVVPLRYSEKTAQGIHVLLLLHTKWEASVHFVSNVIYDFPTTKVFFVSSSHAFTPQIHYIILSSFSANIFFTSEFKGCIGHLTKKSPVLSAL